LGEPLKKQFAILATIIVIFSQTGFSGTSRAQAALTSLRHTTSAGTSNPLPKPFFKKVTVEPWGPLHVEWSPVIFKGNNQLTGYTLTYQIDCPPTTAFSCSGDPNQSLPLRGNQSAVELSSDKTSWDIDYIDGLLPGEDIYFTLQAHGTLYDSLISDTFKKHVLGRPGAPASVVVTRKGTTVIVTWSRNEVTDLGISCNGLCEPRQHLQYVYVALQGQFTSYSEAFQLAPNAPRRLSFTGTSQMDYLQATVCNVNEVSSGPCGWGESQPVSWLLGPSLPTFNFTSESATAVTFHATYDPSLDLRKAKYFEVQVSQDSSFNTVERDLSIPASTRDFAIKNLLPGTNYYFNVRSVSADGTSEWSGGSGITTLTLPGPVDGLRYLINSKTIDLDWNASTDTDFPVTAYSIVYSDTADFAKSRYLTIKAPLTHCVLKNIMGSNAKIYVKIWAKTTGGDGQISSLTIAQ
jgi:hypothetical protein